MASRIGVREYIIVAACILLAVGAAMVHRTGQLNGSAKPTRLADVSSRETSTGRAPLRIAAGPRALLVTPREQQEHLFNRVRPPFHEKPGVSLFLHVLRLHGVDGHFDHPVLNDSQKVLRLLTDSEFGRSFFGAPAIKRTRHGIEFVSAALTLEEHTRATESHRDQCLASLGELGVPLSTPITVGEEKLTLEAALTDSLANFHLKQNELQWTAIAYALYVPPRKEWVNKFGERHTFDDLANRLLTDPVENSSCAGTHLGYALTLLYRVDRTFTPILSQGVRERLRQRLERTVAAAIGTQSEDGSWSGEWGRTLYSHSDHTPSANEADMGGRLLVTGHLCEWFLYVPAEFNVPDDCLRRAGLWLRSQLEDFPGDSVPEAAICPYTHAACALRALSRGN